MGSQSGRVSRAAGPRGPRAWDHRRARVSVGGDGVGRLGNGLLLGCGGGGVCGLPWSLRVSGDGSRRVGSGQVATTQPGSRWNGFHSLTPLRLFFSAPGAG